MQTIILGAGCFWCSEASFRFVKGVQNVMPGYTGGCAETANYKDLCTGTTDHVEVIQVTFDETIIDTKTLLHIFFTIHDPTQLNRQGNDVGTQYASAVFYNSSEQKNIVEDVIKGLRKSGIDVVTRVEPEVTFYPAEEYHQNYYAKNPEQGYCNAMIPPKLAKIRSKYSDYFVV